MHHFEFTEEFITIKVLTQDVHKESAVVCRVEQMADT